jgi:hypothetical protein
MLIFTEGGKPENPKKNPRSKGENQQQTQLAYNTESGNRNRVLTVVRGKRSNYNRCTTHASHTGIGSVLNRTTLLELTILANIVPERLAGP